MKNCQIGNNSQRKKVSIWKISSKLLQRLWKRKSSMLMFLRFIIQLIHLKR